MNSTMQGIGVLARKLPLVLVATGLAVILAGAPDARSDPKPFGLPFAEPPGLSTWYLAQPFGNTAYAYFERRSIYGAGQGFHMGLDFAAACGTPVVAIGEGTVLSIDGRGGSLPHNLMIDHHNGYVSLYGHLLEKPGLTEGQPVAKGEVIAKSGDMYATCYSSPHLHLEIRDRGLNRLHNPATLIDADWNSLLLLGDSPVFEVDLDTPRKWQSMEDQPTIQIGGPLLNDYAHAWPSDNR